MSGFILNCFRCGEYGKMIGIPTDDPHTTLVLCGSEDCSYCDGCETSLVGKVVSIRYFSDGMDDINKDEPQLLCPPCTIRWELEAERCYDEHREHGE